MIEELLGNTNPELLVKFNDATFSLKTYARNTSTLDSCVIIPADLEKEIKDFLGETIFSVPKKLP